MTNPFAPSDFTDNTRSALRASDAEREQAANLLRDHCAAGRLAPDELTERLDRAYHARELGDLRALFDDLPPAAPAAIVKPPRHTFSKRPPRELIAIPTAAALAALAAVTDAHLLWLAWPLLAVWRPHRWPHPGRSSLTAGR